MVRIAALGDLTADLVLPVTMPIEAGQSIQIPWYAVEPGGAGNFLIAGARLGAEMLAIGAVGDDVFGRYALDMLRAEGIDVSGETLSRGITTTLVTVLVQPDAGQFSYIWHGKHEQPLPVSESAAAAIARADAVFMQGYTFWEKSLRPLVDHAIMSGQPIWFDVGPAAHGIARADVAYITSNAYAIMATEEELPMITDGLIGTAVYDTLLKAGVKLIVVKRGAAGCSVITPEGITDIAAFRVPVRDLVGAGDSFNAAFIYGTLLGLAPQDAGMLANATGAAKIQKVGTGRSMPTRREVESVLVAAGKTLAF